MSNAEIWVRNAATEIQEVFMISPLHVSSLYNIWVVIADWVENLFKLLFFFFLVQSFHWWIIWYLWCLLPTFSKQIRTQLFLVLNSEQSHCDVTHWSLKLPLLSVPDFTFPPWNSCPIPKLRKRWSMGGAERSLIKPGECKTAVFAK